MTETEITMEIEERAHGSAVVVSLNGRLDALGSPDLEARICALADRGDARVVLDCARMTYISSGGLRAFVIGAKRCQEMGGKLAIAALRPHCLSVVEVSGLLPIIGYHDTSEAALAALEHAASAKGDEQPATGGKTPMAIEERKDGSTVVVSIRGRLDGLGAPELEARISAIVARDDVNVVLDCARMTYLGSGGLRALLVGARKCRKRGGKLVIAALRSECRLVLGMSGFLSVVDCHETCEAALAALS